MLKQLHVSKPDMICKLSLSIRPGFGIAKLDHSAVNLGHSEELRQLATIIIRLA